MVNTLRNYTNDMFYIFKVILVCFLFKYLVKRKEVEEDMENPYIKL